MDMFLDNISMALSQIRSNKMRSFLTMLGIMIGISSVIAIMTVGESMNRAISEAMNEFGAGNISFYLTEKETAGEKEYTYRDLRDSDCVSEEVFEDMRRHFAGRVQGISLSENIGDGTIESSNTDQKISINGVNSMALDSRKLQIESGRVFDSADYSNMRRVIIISSKLAEELYGEDYIHNAIGKVLECEISGKYYGYTILGIYEYDPSASGRNMFAMGSTPPSEAFIPLRTAFAETNRDMLFTYFDVVADPEEDAQALMDEISAFINSKYYRNNDAFEMQGYSMQAIIRESEQTIGMVKLAISAIAAISLLVGGIGVMNIMIVSITERTREIGTRKALGATNNSIRLQFITEAIVLCITGGVIGLAGGTALGLGASKLMRFPVTAPVKWMVISVLFSMAMGLFFGIYPANKAARMNPIDALRYE